MPAANPIQTNFTSGELSPRMLARVDLEQYRNGAAEITNFQVLPTGGLTKRPGSYFVASAKVATGRVRLVPFVVSGVAAYVLEFGAGYVRFYRNRGQALGSSAPLELATPYALDHLRELRFAQSADVMTICHVAYAPREIRRTGSSTFTIGLVAFEDGPYDTENIGDPGASPPATTATPAEASTAGGATSGSGSGTGDAPGMAGTEATGDGAVGGSDAIDPPTNSVAEGPP